jgi:hypothetical protein
MSQVRSAGRRKYEEWRAYACAARTSTNEQLAELAMIDGADGTSSGIDFSQVRVDCIDSAALALLEEWDSEQGFPWNDAPAVVKEDSRNFDLSLWYGDLLCGLCFATPSGKRTVVRIKLLEGRPKGPEGPHPLKGRVIELCVFAVSQYCKIIGATQIEIDKPLPGAVPAYLDASFKMVQGSLVLDLDA